MSFHNSNNFKCVRGCNKLASPMSWSSRLAGMTVGWLGTRKDWRELDWRRSNEGKIMDRS